VIETLRRMLAAAFGRRPGAEPPAQPRSGPGEAEQRFDEARRRLKARIPPPED
jgi:hypothetical protein